MKLIYGKQDFPTLDRGEEGCWLLANGLGGYATTSLIYSATRCDGGLLVRAVTAPNCRENSLIRISEQIQVGEGAYFLSSQQFGDGREPEDGYRQQVSFSLEDLPRWEYQVSGCAVARTCALVQGENTLVLAYQVENRSGRDCTLLLRPSFLFRPKGEGRESAAPISWDGERVCCDGSALYLAWAGECTPIPPETELLAFPEEGKMGRAGHTVALQCLELTLSLAPGEEKTAHLVLSDRPVTGTGAELLSQAADWQRKQADGGHFRDPVARRLAQSAAAFLVRRDSTDGLSMIAGYPFFGDWGRDTMIALPGCVLATGQTQAAKSILSTFLRYEYRGLLPNLFPEGGEEPRYNSADAPLLLINAVWLYYGRTGDLDFLRTAFPVLKRIAGAYEGGTLYHIAMEEDGLVCAGAGLDQVTWMDVCVDGILPTPRHGKPVEINAYWYNALCILARIAPLCGGDSEHYVSLAGQVRESFQGKFWKAEGYLKDVLSGGPEEDQIRPNQIWAVTMPFSPLEPDQERQVVETVYRHLWTPVGLRTLSPEDGEFHPFYRGGQLERDLAYHQGTVWPFPLGAFYLAWWKVYGHTAENAARIRRMLAPLEAALREGCAGQLPEIYDGENPAASRGCFAQAWSVGELLRVYEALEQTTD